MSDQILREAARLLRAGAPVEPFAAALDDQTLAALVPLIATRLACPKCNHPWLEHCAEPSGYVPGAVGCLVGYGDDEDEWPPCECHEAPPMGCTHAGTDPACLRLTKRAP